MTFFKLEIPLLINSVNYNNNYDYAIIIQYNPSSLRAQEKDNTEKKISLQSSFTKLFNFIDSISVYEINCNSKIVFFYNSIKLILVPEVRVSTFSIPKSNRVFNLSLLGTFASVIKGDHIYNSLRCWNWRIVNL